MSQLHSPSLSLAASIGRLERDFARQPALDRLALDPAAAAELDLPGLAAFGAAVPDPAQAGRWQVLRETLYQLPVGWLTQPHPVLAQRYVMTQGRRHPVRPAKPTGVLYERHIPWLDRSLRLRALDLETDLPTVHRWLNDPVVDAFWQEAGDVARHRAYLATVAADPHVQSLIIELGGRPIGYVEAYWAKEDRIAPFCDAQDHDRGWHVLIGESDCRGREFLTAWMPSVSHYLFLADPRTQRIVIEPRSDNARMIRSLSRCGYALVKEFDFPHKRAMLGVLLRERFFGEALWIPQPSPEGAPR